MADDEFLARLERSKKAHEGVLKRLADIDLNLALAAAEYEQRLHAAEAQVDRLRAENERLRDALAESWLNAEHGTDWYIGDATTEDWERIYAAIGEYVNAEP